MAVGGKQGRTFVHSKGPGEEYLMAQEFEGLEISPPSGEVASSEPQTAIS